jgi:hypothetical protein
LKILVIHNEEHERLNYLIPQAEDLTKAFQSVAGSCALELVGPEERGRNENLVPNTWSNRLRRARDAARLFAEAERSTPAPNGPLRKTRIGLRRFIEMISYQRPITVEQDVMTGHAECWRRIAGEGDFGIIMESDTVFREDSTAKLINLTTWLKKDERHRKPFYIDLAGGCDRRQILNAWCFEEEYGGKRLNIEGLEDTTVFLLPKLTNNTGCAYYISADFAHNLYTWFENYRPMMSADWTTMLWAAIGKNVGEITCIHSEPPILVHGSVTGEYQPWAAEL